MYENAVPVFEMKNKLSFYLHKVDEGPVFISNRGKAAYVIQTIEDYEKQIKDAPKEKTPYEVACEIRNEIGLKDDHNFDLNDFIESIKQDSSSESYRTRQLIYDLNGGNRLNE